MIDVALYLLFLLMILGAIVALKAKDLLSAVISFGVVGFGLVLVFLFLQAPDLAIVQIVVETLTLVIMVAAILKTSRKDVVEKIGPKKVFLSLSGLAFLIMFFLFIYRAFSFLPEFGKPAIRMASFYLEQGLELTGAANLVTAVILDFRAYDTLGEAAVLFTAAMGVIVVLRKIGRKK